MPGDPTVGVAFARLDAHDREIKEVKENVECIRDKMDSLIEKVGDLKAGVGKYVGIGIGALAAVELAIAWFKH